MLALQGIVVFIVCYVIAKRYGNHMGSDPRTYRKINLADVVCGVLFYYALGLIAYWLYKQAGAVSDWINTLW